MHKLTFVTDAWLNSVVDHVYLSIFMREYINFSNQYQRIIKRFDVSHYEIELLNIVARMQLAEEKVHVGHLISVKDLASQATLHKILGRLIDKKLLCFRAHQHDGRIKHVFLAQQGFAYIKAVNSALLGAKFNGNRKALEA